MAVWSNWEGCFRVITVTPTNPYTKQVFRTVDLYNLYYHMKWNTNIIIPQFFHLWFLEGFCTTAFSRKNDQFIRKMCVRQFTKTTSNQSQLLYRNVLEMLSEYYYTCKWKIHEDFPEDVLVEAMRPYLYLHYLITFNIVSFRLASYYEIVLNRELSRFYNSNKSFGRKTYVITKQFLCNKAKTYTRSEVFHTETVGFSSWNL